MKVTVDRALLEQELEFLNRVTHWQEGKPDLHDRKVALRVALRQAIANNTLDKMAENEKELGIQIQPADVSETNFGNITDEPVAWQWLNTANFRKTKPKYAECGSWNPLYTRPQRKEWVGLSDEDIRQLGLSNYTQAIREAEAKLKEKNQ